MYRFHLAASTLFKLTSTWRAKCGNDSEALYVYTAFLLALAAEAVKTVGMSEEDASAEVSATLSAFSVSSMTNIPRETVRRKLKILAERGMIRQGPGSAYTLTLAREAIREFVQRGTPLEMPYDWEALQ
ncbi:MAG: hypothetical protein ACK4TR_10635 [Phenylobacterium sp.]|uniref:hypothetical protein n=1 Tax=Phenylobacterium sp. TaxID=1871053 RepID=UPI00391B5749